MDEIPAFTRREVDVEKLFYETRTDGWSLSAHCPRTYGGIYIYCKDRAWKRLHRCRFLRSEFDLLHALREFHV